MGRLLKGRMLAGPLIVGARLPGARAGTYGTEVMPDDAGLARLEAAVARLERTPPREHDVLMGKMSHEQWKVLHRRHAELHLSFFWIVDGAARADEAVVRGAHDRAHAANESEQ